jgi:hypothetical protein
MIFVLSRLPQGLRLALALLFGGGLLCLLFLASRGDLADRNAGRARWDAERSLALQAGAQMRTAAERVHAYAVERLRTDPTAGANEDDPLLAGPAQSFRLAYERYGRELVANGQDGQNLAGVGVAWQAYLRTWDQVRLHSRRAASDPTVLDPAARPPYAGELAEPFAQVTTAIDRLVEYRRLPADTVVLPVSNPRSVSRLLVAIGLLAGLCALVALGVLVTLRARPQATVDMVPPVEGKDAATRAGPAIKA